MYIHTQTNENDGSCLKHMREQNDREVGVGCLSLHSSFPFFSSPSSFLRRNLVSPIPFIPRRARGSLSKGKRFKQESRPAQNLKSCLLLPFLTTSQLFL